MVLADSHKISRVPCYSGEIVQLSMFTRTGLSPSTVVLSNTLSLTILTLLNTLQFFRQSSHNPSAATAASFNTTLV